MFLNYQIVCPYTHIKNDWTLSSEWTGSNLEHIFQPNSFLRKPNNLNHTKFYLEPFTLLSLFPGQNIENEKVFKLYFGIKLRHFFKDGSLSSFINSNFNLFRNSSVLNNLKRHFDTKEALNKTNLTSLFNFLKLKLSIIVNDDLNPISDCFQSFDLNSSNFPNFDDLIKDQNPRNKGSIFHFNKQILLPQKCLLKNQINNIKLLINSLNDQTNDLLIEPNSFLKINFLLSEKSTEPLTFNLNERQTIFNNYWYLITTKVNNEPKITPVNGEILKFHSHIKSRYQNSRPFESLWSLEFTPINYVLLYENILREHFYFPVLLKEIRKIISWNKVHPIIPVQSKINSSCQEFFLEGQGVRQSSIKDQKKFSIQSKNYNLSFFNKHHRHFFKKSNHFDFLKNELVKDFARNDYFSNTLINSWKCENDEVNIQNNLSLRTFANMNLNILQKVTFDNHFVNEKIFISKDTDIPKNNSLTNEKILNLKQNILEKISANKIWNWSHYWAVLKMWLPNNHD